MIRWILGLKWLSITLVSLCVLFVASGIELLASNWFGVLAAGLIGLSVFTARRQTIVSIVIAPVAVYLIATYSAFPTIMLVISSLVFLFIGLFGARLQRLFGFVSAIISAVIFGLESGYTGDLLFALVGAPNNTEFYRTNALLLLTAISGCLFVLAQLLGRQAYIQIEHIGSSRDQASSTVKSAKLGLEVSKQNERLVIARDLSQLLVEQISSVVSVTEGGRYAIASDPSSAGRVLAKAHEAGVAAQNELRRLYDYLGSSIISEVAKFRISDLEELAVSYRELGYNTVIKHQGEHFALNEGMELCVYKIVFEALQNVRKNCPLGTDVDVDFLWVEDGLQVLIKDNGVEFENRAKAAIGEVVEGYSVQEDLQSLVQEIDGATLTALRDRAAIYKGRIEATVVAGVGFTLSAIFPGLKSLAEKGQ
jgi:signal transduction histidine kinase